MIDSDIADEEIAFCDSEFDNFVPKLTKCWLLQIAMGPTGKVIAYADQPGYPPISEGLALIKNAKAVVWHNAFGYDIWAVNKLYPGTCERHSTIDTLILSRLRDSTASRHSLADIGEVVGLRKMDFEDFSEFSDKMAVYGVRDVEIMQRAWVGTKTYPGLGAFWRKYRQACDLEFQTAYVIQKQINHGFRFDYDAALLLEAELRQEFKDIERKLQDIFPPIITQRFGKKGQRLKDDIEVFNPGSNDQIAHRLITKYGWKPKAKTPTGKAKIDETILEAMDYPEAQEVARYKHLGKKLGMLADGENSWLKLAEEQPDGTYRIFGRVNTLGARTHRMSHYKPNVAQVDKDPRMRALFLSDRGRKLVGVDAEGLELRMLAHYLHPYDAGAYVKIITDGKKEDKTSIHWVNMRAGGLWTYDWAKTMIYAFNYGAWDNKLGSIVVEDAREAGQPVPKGTQNHLGAALRARLTAGIQGLGTLTDKCKHMHDRATKLPGLDGRWIPSASDHSSLNTLLQGNGSIVMKQALVCFEDELTRRGFLDRCFFVGNIHDEVICTCDEDIAEEVAEIGKWAIEQAGIILGVRCPLRGEAKIGRNWAETH